jgi:predicted ribonuclease toxin of YeeF-YezG toxin-antitoxin module
LIDRQIAFLNGISGSAEDKDLSGNTVVHLPFLEDELVHHIRNNKEMVARQQDELQRIFNRIDDLIPLNVFSKSGFDDHIEKADKDRKDTIDAVNELDQELKSEYMLSEGDERYVTALFQQLIEATRQGNTISPIYFNSEAYKSSEIYQLKGQAEQQTIDYLTFKKNQEEVRKQQAEVKAEIEARKRAEAEFAKLNSIEKSLHSFKEIGNDFWDG